MLDVLTVKYQSFPSETHNGKIEKDDAGRLYVTDKDGTREIRSVFDRAGLKNIFPALMSDA